MTEVRKCIDRHPDFFDCHAVGVAVNAELGHAEQARIHAAELRRLDPFFKAANYGALLTCAGPAESLRQSLRDGSLE